MQLNVALRIPCPPLRKTGRTQEDKARGHYQRAVTVLGLGAIRLQFGSHSEKMQTSHFADIKGAFWHTRTTREKLTVLDEANLVAYLHCLPFSCRVFLWACGERRFSCFRLSAGLVSGLADYTIVS